MSVKELVLYSMFTFYRLHADMDSIISIVLQDVSDDNTANGGMCVCISSITYVYVPVHTVDMLVIILAAITSHLRVAKVSDCI